MKPARSQPRASFTVLEVLLATAITALVAGLLVMVVARMAAGWARASGLLAATADGERILRLVTRDLENLRWADDGSVRLAATVQPDQTGAGDAGGTSLAAWSAGVSVKPGWSDPGAPHSSLNLAPAGGRLEECRFGQAGVWLRCITLVADDNTEVANASAPRAVAYQIVRHTTATGGGGAVRYSLFRSEVRPVAASGPLSTFGVGADVFAGPYNDPSLGGTAVADPGNVRRPRREWLLGNNVVDFGVRIRGRDPGGRWRLLFPADADGRPSHRNLGFAATTDPDRLPPAVASRHRYGPGEVSHGRPAEIEILVRVLPEAAARELEALEFGRIAPRDWWDWVGPRSVVVTARVTVPGGDR